MVFYCWCNRSVEMKTHDLKGQEHEPNQSKEFGFPLYELQSDLYH